MKAPCMMHVQGNESTTPLTNQMMNKTDKREMTCHLSVIFGMSKQTIEDSSGLPSGPCLRGARRSYLSQSFVSTNIRLSPPVDNRLLSSMYPPVLYWLKQAPSLSRLEEAAIVTID